MTARPDEVDDHALTAESVSGFKTGRFELGRLVWVRVLTRDEQDDIYG